MPKSKKGSRAGKRSRRTSKTKIKNSAAGKAKKRMWKHQGR